MEIPSLNSHLCVPLAQMNAHLIPPSPSSVGGDDQSPCSS